MNYPNTLLARIAVTLFLLSTVASAQTYTVLDTYPGTASNDSGVFSQVLAQGRDGNFYSTIATGGANNNNGTAYKMTTAGQPSTIYNFCELTGCADGAIPYGGLTLGFSGNLYGTTQNGGAGAAGTIFSLTPTGTLTTLYSFMNKTDDSAPSFTLLQGQDGNLYGVSEAQYNTQYGAFFKITSAGKFSVLYDFDFTHGDAPNLPTEGTDGNFYGTTLYGSSANFGVIYKLTPAGAITVLHNFAGYPNDGSYPEGILVQGNDGNFYGVTKEGGANNEGTIFKISSTGTYSLLHSFNYSSPTFDGMFPVAGLALGSDGNLYGTTAQGGKNSNAGTIFQVTTAGQETILYNFCAQTGCVDGFYPYGPIVQHTDGAFYGTTTGSSLGGSVFYSLNTGLKPFVDLLNWEGKVGATIEILGQGFTGATKVSFNGVSATFNNSSDTYMTAVVPAGATTGNVTVTTFTGTMTSSRKFLVTPQIKSFSPTSGPVGTAVTIVGQSFTQTRGVGFGDYVPAKFTVNSDSQVTATVPEGAKTGPVGIETAGGIAIFGTFTVTPAVIGFSPMQGPVGTTVTINGTSFTGATKVTFGGTAASSFQVISDTEVKALVPTGAVTGPVAVTTSSGTGVSSQNFTVTQ
jgi:uncharacterized repeat protein (TIGR03803 family)